MRRPDAPDPALRALAEAALEIGRERAKILDEMRGALLRNDTERALDCARRLTGLEDGDAEEGDRARSGVH